MTHKGLVEFYQKQVDKQLGEGVVQVDFIADEDVRPHDTYVQGFFDVYWLENGYDAPILLEIISYCDADIDDSEMVDQSEQVQQQEDQNDQDSNDGWDDEDQPDEDGAWDEDEDGWEIDPNQVNKMQKTES